MIFNRLRLFSIGLWLTAGILGSPVNVLGLNDTAIPGGFYVWQREWTPAVKAAVRTCGRDLYLLAGEFAWEKRSLVVAAVAIPDEPYRRPDVTLTYRIHVGALESCPAERIAEEIRRYDAKQIQLDVDCPEKKLILYERLIVRLKRLLPGKKFSVTVLPCHLRQAEFRDLVKHVDYYVLQVHGLNVPSSFDDDCRLIRREVALDAINQAEKLGLPFKVALPAYAYQLNFDRASGRFMGLNAEPKTLSPEKYSSRLTTIDFNLLHDILFRKPTLSVIWFRMPIVGDRLTLDQASISALERGEIPIPGLKADCRRVAPNRFDLVLRSKATFGFGTAKIKMTWVQPTGEFDLFGATVNVSDNRGFGVLPQLLEVPIPGCGQEFRAASFYIDFKPIKVELQ